jgi:hypothetical protein
MLIYSLNILEAFLMHPKKIIERLSDKELAVLQTILPSEFERRGLDMPTAVPALASRVDGLVEQSDFKVCFDVSEEYEHATRAIEKLGIPSKKRSTVPSLESVSDAISPETMQWLSLRAQSGIHDELVISPSLGEYSLEQLIKQFDSKQTASTYIWNDLWSKYSEEQHNSNLNEWHVAIILNDTRDPKDNRKPVNNFGEPGLVYTGQNLQGQQKLFAKEKRSFTKRKLSLEPITPAQIMLLNIRRQNMSLPMLDERTFTRLIQYPKAEIGDMRWVPAACWLRARLRLFGSETDQVWSRFGTRRVLGL